MAETKKKTAAKKPGKPLPPKNSQVLWEARTTMEISEWSRRDEWNDAKYDLPKPCPPDDDQSWEPVGVTQGMTNGYGQTPFIFLWRRQVRK